MTDRRSFFKSLALLIGAASVSPMIFLPKFEPVKWKFTAEWYRFDGMGRKVPFDPLDAANHPAFYGFIDSEVIVRDESFWQAYERLASANLPKIGIDFSRVPR